MQQAYGASTGRAAALLDQVNRALICAAGERRTGRAGVALGARPPASVAGGRVSLEVLMGSAPGAVLVDDRGGLEAVQVSAQITAAGSKTARRGLPRILAALDPRDPRRRLCDILADTAERVGSVKGALSDGGGGGYGGVNDGGATTRIKHVSRLRLIEAQLNGWDVERGGRIRRGPPRVVLAVQRQRGLRHNIKAMDAVVSLCVEGHSLNRILRVHGWAAHRDTRKSLASAVLEVLAEAAEAHGLGRW